MSNGRYIYIGAKPDLVKHHPGGQSTASLGLIDFCLSNDITLEIIDSAQESFPVPTITQRLGRALNRQFILLKKLFTARYDGVIIFSGERISFIEKSFSALLCRLLLTETVLFVRSGYFITDCESSPALRRMSRWLLHIPHRIAAQGSTWVDFYRTLGVQDKRIMVIRNWLSPGRTITSQVKHVSAKSGQKVTFIFVGWVVKEKGANELMTVIRRSEKLQQCRIIFAGNGGLHQQFCDIQHQEKLNNVELPGWQTPEQIDDLLEQAHVFVLPTYAEGFPNALLEALSKGLPAVITPVGGIPDSAKDGENAIWVEPKDSNGLQMAMERFVDNPEMIEQYSRRSIEIAKANHDRDINCQRLFNSFKHAPQFKQTGEESSN